MFMAAFISRSWAAPQGQTHDRVVRDMLLFINPHAEHIFDVFGAGTSIHTLPVFLHCHSHSFRSIDHPASLIDLPRVLRTIPDTFRFSRARAWFLPREWTKLNAIC